MNFIPSRNKTTRWSADHVAAITDSAVSHIAPITAADVRDIIPGLMLWDMWPVQRVDGRSVCVDGWEIWVIMCAARDLHPDARHDVARLRLAMCRNGHWQDCGYLLPDDLNPGAREWAGSTVYDPESGAITLFYTATGRREDATPTFEQRLFQTTGTLLCENGTVRTAHWSEPFENIVSDDDHYMVANATVGRPGFIKGFRDPCHFRDPADGVDYLLFTASLKASSSDFNGVIGLARSDDGKFGDWQIMPPLISADGLNNEMERPVMRMKDGRYYVFWSTQRRTFAPDGPSGPNGLYGMVSDTVLGSYRPLNGTGLVAANPPQEPCQTYSWWVTEDLQVAGFIDHWGLQGRRLDEHPELVISQFGGVPAPRFRIALDGDTAHIVFP